MEGKDEQQNQILIYLFKFFLPLISAALLL